jgi:hypothetical protein
MFLYLFLKVTEDVLAQALSLCFTLNYNAKQAQVRNAAAATVRQV